MADILKTYTSEQLYTMYRNYTIAKGAGLTDFNSGSKTRALIESNSEIVSSISMDFKKALYTAIPIALYKGFGFEKLGAEKAIGYLRLYRVPALWVKYTGAGTSAKVTSTATNITSAVIGAPGDAFTFAYSTYDEIGALVTIIDAEPNWEATLVKGSTVPSNTLYQYTAQEAVGETNYLYGTGLDIMLATAIEVVLIAGYSVSVDSLTFLTTLAGTLSAGESSVTIAAEVQTAGITGNIALNGIDTLNGKGYINSTIGGIEQVINDSAFSGGDVAETDAERKTRFSETVNALNAGTEAGIVSAIKGITGVRSVGMRASYPFKGTNTIIVDDGTSTVSAALLAAVEKVLYGDANDIVNYPGKNAEGIGYTITAPTLIPIDIGIVVYRLPNVNVDLTAIKTTVQTAVEQYVNTRALGENVLLSEVVRVGKNSDAAAYDLIVSSPANNVAISENEFAKTGSGTGGTITVTVSIATTV